MSAFSCSIKNSNIKLTYNGSNWSSPSVVNYSPLYQYYAYYPYSDKGLANSPSATQSDATTFFKSGIDAFTPATDQSNATSFNNSDLQVGKAAINRITASDITFDFTHSMGIAKMSITTAQIPTTVTYDGNTSKVLSYSDAKTTVGLVKEFSGNLPLSATNNTYYALVNPDKTTTFHSKSVDILQNPWTIDVNAASNSIQSYTTPVCIRQGYQIARAYNYTGNVQTYNVPYDGTYKLEVYGAGDGALGGYSYGNMRISKRNLKILYIVVGSSNRGHAGGYNGGGNSGPGGGAGSGATHIATTNHGELSNYLNFQDEVIIVAGGAGGLDGISGNETMVGSSGGGDKGGDGLFERSGEVYKYGTTGGTQTTGGIGGSSDISGKFGKGGDSPGSSGDFGSGGGGGWYGGGASVSGGPAGGGSGHLGSQLIAGTTGMQNGINSGNGKAVITYLP